MNKQYHLIVIVLIFCGVAHANILSEIFRNDARPQKSSKSQIAKERDTFQRNCISRPTNYGIQLYCKKLSEPLRVVADKSPAIKCAQTTMGVSSNFPNSITLSTKFLNTLNSCEGEIHGPNYIRAIVITAESMSNNNFVEYNRSDTYYDIVCKDKSSYYESFVYAKMQRDMLNDQNKRYQACLNNVPEPQAQKFRYIFYIFVAIALLAFVMFLIKKFKKH